MEPIFSPPEVPKRESFTKFRELPPELRITIWKFALPDARTVIVKSPYAHQKQTPASLDTALSHADEHEETWQSPTPIPALLHVNAEARYEALKHYSLSLGVGTRQPRVYVDLRRDTLFFGAAELQPSCSSLWAMTNDLDEVRRLAVVSQGAWRALRWRKFSTNSLEKLILVHEDEGLRPRCLPQLVEDGQPEVSEQPEQLEQPEQIEQPEPDFNLKLEQHASQGATDTTGSETDPEIPKNQRIQDAMDELDTLKMVLLETWEEEPVISTAVFRETVDIKDALV
ncbi:hypothetical protein F4808DRAFT_410642 [Astrocystis sublimbata]|nr:hypothetical protein F4808DRAFT_410642 [Astrocystis sublimbata]